MPAEESKKMLGETMLKMSKMDDPDQIVKNAIMEHMTEHLEMADYNAMIMLAEKCGEMETADKLRETLSEEEEMADKTMDGLKEAMENFSMKKGIEQSEE